VIDELFNKIRGHKSIVYDVETNGLDWKKNAIVGHVLSFSNRPEDSYYVPVRHEGGNRFDDPTDFESNLFEAMKGKLLIGHNMKFDAHFANSHGADFTRHNEMECTLVNQSLINEHQGKYNLDFCCEKMKIEQRKEDRIYAHMAEKFGGAADRDQMKNYWRLSGDDEVAVAYAVADGMATHSLWAEQQKILDEQGLRRVWQLEKRTLRTLIRMERRGVRVNEDYLDQLRRDLDKRIRDAASRLPADFNVRSSAMMAKLFVELGHDPVSWPRTAPSTRFPDGQPSFTEKWLDGHEIGRDIIAVRRLTNMVNSFIDPLKSTHLFNWRVHTSFNQVKQDDYGTVSGRLSSSDPNLQQVPKHDKELAPLFRGAFEADPGMYWSSNDYKQQEIVVFANFSRSEKVLEGYRQDPPVDFHQLVADMMHVDRSTKAKRLNLGKLYGMGKDKLAISLGVTPEEAARLSKEWDRMMPDAVSLRRECEQAVKGRVTRDDIGFIRTLFGRRRRYPDLNKAYAAMSGLIQGSCADICKDKMCEVDEYFESEGDQAHLLLQVHDSLDWQVPDGMEHMDKEAQRIMQEFKAETYGEFFKCPMRIDVGRGKTWKEASL